MKCIFCQIVAGEIPADILYQDEEAMVFRDINPQAPKHLLIVPKSHISSVAELNKEQMALVGHLVWVANEQAKREGIAQSGYRLVINCGAEAGQEVSHVHLHLLGGRSLGKMG